MECTIASGLSGTASVPPRSHVSGLLRCYQGDGAWYIVPGPKAILFPPVWIIGTCNVVSLSSVMFSILMELLTVSISLSFEKGSRL